MSFKSIVVPVLAFGAVAVLIFAASGAAASHIDFEQRRAEREAAREQRAAEREAEREARRIAREEEKEQEDTSCTCSAKLAFSKPSLQFKNGVLSFIPRVDVTIRSRGEASAPDWSATLEHSGSSSYSSEDVTVPGGTSFSGSEQIVGGSCGSNFTFRGHALPEVSLNGLSQSLVGIDQELKGSIDMSATLKGCGDDESAHRMFGFKVLEFGNIKTGSWRTIR